MPVPITSAVLPHSLDAEQTVLGALLIDPDAIVKVITSLQPEHFYDPTYRDIFAAMTQLFQNGSSIDVITVNNKLRSHQRVQESGGVVFLGSLTDNLPTASHVERYADIVKQQAVKRAVIRAGEQIKGLGFDDETKTDELIDQMEQVTIAVSDDVVSGGHAATMAELCQARYEDYAAAHVAKDKDHHTGLKTGYHDLDRLMVGMEPGDLVILAGRPSMGKTALALNIIRNVGIHQGKGVVFFSLEQSDKKIVDRMVSSMAQVPATDLKKGTLDDDSFSRLPDALDKLSQANIHIDSDPNSTLTALRSKARRLSMQQPIDLVVVDYLQLITGTERWTREDPVNWTKQVSQSLKQLARELSVPVIALAQLNRNLENRPKKEPVLSDLKESGAIEQDADIVLMMYRDEYYFEDSDRIGLADVFIRKNRDGATGDVELRWHPERMTFSDSQ